MTNTNNPANRFPPGGPGPTPAPGTPDPTSPAPPPWDPPAAPPPWDVPARATTGTPAAYAGPDHTAIYPSTAAPGGTPAPGMPPPPGPPTGGVLPPGSRGPGPLPWILGAVVVLALAGLLVFLLARNGGAATPTPGPTTPTTAPSDTPVPTSTPYIIVVTATPGPPPTASPVPAVTATPAAPAVTPSPPATNTPLPVLPTVTPLPTATETPPPSPTPSDTPVPVNSPTPGGPATPPAFTTTPGATPAPGTPSPPAVGTGGYADTAPAESVPGYLTIQWFGQSCFLLAGGNGPRILVDPVGPDYGYRLPFFDALDALLISHYHADHTFTKVVPGNVPNYVGLDGSGQFQAIQQAVGNATVRDVSSYHDNNSGRERGVNAMWVIDIDGFHVVHLGDLGQSRLTPQQVGDLGRPDILMLPVGGNTGADATLDGAQAINIANQLRARLVIPMHYQTDRTPPGQDLAPLSDFLGSAPPANPPNVVRLQQSQLPTGPPQVLVMSYR